MDPSPPAVYELVLTGSPFELALPDICAHCGAEAKRRLHWERVIEDYNDGHTTTVVAAHAPFCIACLAQHEREVKRMPTLESILQCFRSEMMIPAVFTGAGTMFFFYVLLPKLPRADLKSLALFGGLIAFFGWISWASFRAAWDATRHHTVPALTTITRSFGFGLNVAATFEGERHRYTLTNERFYEAFQAANENRRWHRSGEQFQAAASKRMLLYVVAGVAMAGVWLWDWMRTK